MSQIMWFGTFLRNPQRDRVLEQEEGSVVSLSLRPGIRLSMEQEYCSPPNSFGGGVLTGLVMTPDPLVTPENELMSLPQTPDPFLMTPDSVDSERDVYFVGKKHVFDVYREFGGPERAAHLLNQILTEKLYDCGVAYEINSRTSRAKTRKSPRTNREHTNGIHVRN